MYGHPWSDVHDCLAICCFLSGLGMLVFVPAAQAEIALSTLKGVCQYNVDRVGQVISRTVAHGKPVVFNGKRT